MEEQLGPERIATVFRLSACKTAKADCAFILRVPVRFQNIEQRQLIGQPNPKTRFAARSSATTLI
jgi:hypothetical protein